MKHEALRNAPLAASGLHDTFARDNLPASEDWPVLDVSAPQYRFATRINCAHELLRAALDAGLGARPALIAPQQTLTYATLESRSNQIAQALAKLPGFISGQRVLVRGPNNPQFVACWLGIIKAGGIAVATMPLLRARELTSIVDAADVALALCDERWLGELENAVSAAQRNARIIAFDGTATSGAELESLTARAPTTFKPVDTAADDVALIAFTSGTTGKPKGTMHFHRDVLAICNGLPRHCLDASSSDRFIGSPPLAFTFGLGGLALFPLSVGGAGILLEEAGPSALAAGIERFAATVCFTAPTAYRAMLASPAGLKLESLRCSISAGETLPAATFEAWQDLTGLASVDALGSTELLHAFVASRPARMRAGYTGEVLAGYTARVVDDAMQPVAPGEPGHLAVKGPTGCRYLNDARQREYVRDGWNLTGDTYAVDESGYFRFVARCDDMIISAGYNIAGPEVETALMAHAAVHECAVVGVPDAHRGQLVQAYVVVHPGMRADTHLSAALQNHVKQMIAPYKYPRRITFIEALPRTETGKVQRFRLRGMDDISQVD
jgi:2-aminobenzoate-CoA ligase